MDGKEKEITGGWTGKPALVEPKTDSGDRLTTGIRCFAGSSRFPVIKPEAYVEYVERLAEPEGSRPIALMRPDHHFTLVPCPNPSLLLLMALPDAPNHFPPPPELPLRVEPSRPTWRQRLKKLFAPFTAVFVVIAKFFALIKGLLLPLLPVLKTGGTMLISIWFYAQGWGWPFAVGFVLLIFVHECGHLVVARWFGLKVGAPMFIPFMGAFIMLKQSPQNAWVEACVGIGGPAAGSLGAAVCWLIGLKTGHLFWSDLAYTGFFLNLFNLTPLGFLDGGRIVTALSPWLWILGLVIAGTMTWMHPNFIVILILVLSLPRLWSLFRTKTDAQKRYFEITPGQRAIMAVMYFGLVGALGFAMYATAR